MGYSLYLNTLSGVSRQGASLSLSLWLCLDVRPFCKINIPLLPARKLLSQNVVAWVLASGVARSCPSSLWPSLCALAFTHATLPYCT